MGRKNQSEIPAEGVVAALLLAARRTLARLRAVEPVGRNEPCPCGSGKKYKHCCIVHESPKRLYVQPRKR